MLHTFLLKDGVRLAMYRSLWRLMTSAVGNPLSKEGITAQIDMVEPLDGFFLGFFPSLFSPFPDTDNFFCLLPKYSAVIQQKIIGNRSICMEAVNRSPVAGRGFGLLLYSNCVPMPRSRWRGAVPVHSALLSVYNKAWLPASGYILSAAGFPVLPYSFWRSRKMLSIRM